MPWTSLRLELARTPEYPDGSANHVYLLHLPIGAAGFIDEVRLRAHPERATVHRYWGEEPHRRGYVLATPAGWAISYEKEEKDDEALFHLETHRLHAGDYVTIIDSDGQRLPMRVVTEMSLVETDADRPAPDPRA